MSKFNRTRLLAVLPIIFACGCAAAIPVSHQERLTVAEIDAHEHAGAGAGTSGVSGIQTIVLTGDPTRAGLYTIELRVPAHTCIQAHAHPDDRSATVISGTWYFGYGAQLDDAA